MKLLLCITAFCAVAAPAFAQDELPRFEALEQQQQMIQQQDYDKLAARQQNTLDRAAQPNSGVTAAERALLDLQFQRAREQQLQPLKQQQEIKRTERDLADQALPNAFIPPFSSAVVTDPQRYILPPAPTGQYYARVNGRFVLVDGVSQRVVQVLAPQPTDPTADVPAGPLPLSDTSLPIRRIGANSALVLHDFRAWSLPPPPQGQYYANVGSRIVLVNGRTELAVKFADGH